MNRMLSIAYLAVTMLCVVTIAYEVGFSPSASCARRAGMVFVTDHAACLPIGAFVPAR